MEECLKLVKELIGNENGMTSLIKSMDKEPTWDNLNKLLRERKRVD